MTMATGKKYLMLAAVITSLNQCCVSQSCAANFLNTVVHEGSSVSFSSVVLGGPMKWQVIPSSVQLNEIHLIIDYGDNAVVGEFGNTYAVNSSELLIFEATSAPNGFMPYSTAGYYELDYQNSICAAVHLIVIKSGPECQCNASDPTMVNISCSVDFAVSTYLHVLGINVFVPIMTWKNSSGIVFVDQPMTELSPLDSSNPGLIRFVSTLNISADDAATYECQLTFAYPPKQDPPPDFLATNSPNFAESCFIANCLLTTTSVTTKTTTSTTATTTSASTTTVATSSSTKTSSVPTEPETTTTTRLVSVLSDTSTSSSTSSSSKTSLASAPGTLPSIQSLQQSTATNPSSSMIVELTTATQSGVEAEVKATSIILGVALAAVISMTVVFAGWFYCFYLKPSANPGSISKPSFIYSDRRFRNYRIN